jgi:hypothetical protein
MLLTAMRTAVSKGYDGVQYPQVNGAKVVMVFNKKSVGVIK